jgi:ferric iron reductase protein FhuF
VIPLLQTLFQGDLSEYGESLACSPAPATAVPIIELIGNHHRLEGILRRQAMNLGVPANDLRAVASIWSLGYLWTLLPPAVVPLSVLGHVFPLRADQMTVQLDIHDNPSCFYIVDEGHSAPEHPTRARYEALLLQHLEPLFESIGKLSGLPLKVLWGNAARYLEVILDQAGLLDERNQRVLNDRSALLQTPLWPDGARNPLYAKQRQVVLHENGTRESVKLHRRCCLNFRLPSETYCRACPLAPQFRRTAFKEKAIAV